MSATLFMEKKGWHTRGYLPHFDGEVVQFITIRLHDSLPQSILEKYNQEKQAGKLKHYYEDEVLQKIDKYLDSGFGDCHLKRPEIAAIIVAALLFYNGKRYKLFSWVIMPNHIHFLIRPNDGFSLSEIIRDFKGYTARAANNLIKRTGTFWHPDYFDRYIKDQKHFLKTVKYIEMNPVEAGLVNRPEEWEFGSASEVD